MTSLSRHYFSTLAANAAILLLGTVGGILAARLLGPAGRGELAVILLWPVAVANLVGSLGLHDAATFFAARHPERFNSLFTALQVLGLAQTLVFGALAYFLLPLVLAGHRPEVIALTRWFLLFLPIGFNSVYLLKLLQGRLLIRQYNLARLFLAAWYTALLLALYFLGRVSLPWIVVGQLAGYALVSLLHVYFVAHHLRPSWQWDPTIFRPLLGYGLKVQLSLTSGYLNLRLDQMVMSVLLAPVALGYYVAAVTFAEPIQSIPLGIGGVTLPAAAVRQDPAEAHGVIAQSLRVAALPLLGSVVSLFFLAPYLLPMFFGTAFTPAVSACRVLLLGAVPLAFTRLLYYSLRALNKPEVPGYSELVGNAATIVFLALLLPRFSFLGAAYASLGAYSVSLLFLLWYMHSRLRLPLWTLVLKGQQGPGTHLGPPHPSDFGDQPQP